MLDLGQAAGEAGVQPGQQLVSGEVLGRHRGGEHVHHRRTSGHGLQLLLEIFSFSKNIIGVTLYSHRYYI